MIALASSLSIVTPTSTSDLIRDLRLLMWVDIVISSHTLKVNSCNFREKFAFVAFAPNNLVSPSQIYLDDFSKST